MLLLKATTLGNNILDTLILSGYPCLTLEEADYDKDP